MENDIQQVLLKLGEIKTSVAVLDEKVTNTKEKMETMYREGKEDKAASKVREEAVDKKLSWHDKIVGAVCISATIIVYLIKTNVL